MREQCLAAHFPSTLVDPLCVALSGASRAELEAAAEQTGPRLPRLEGLRWRLDVQLASSAVARVLRPQILMEFTLSDGRVHTLAVSPEEFHALRYGTARVLREMLELEGHPIMRLAADMERGARKKQGR